MKRQWDLHKSRMASINTLTFINGVAKIRLHVELAQNDLQNPQCLREKDWLRDLLRSPQVIHKYESCVVVQRRC